MTVPARTRQGKSSRFDVLIRRSDASGNSAPRTLPMPQGGATPTSGCVSAREKRKRIFKACGGLFVRCGEKCEAHQVIPRRWLHPCSARFRFTWFRCSAYPLSGSVLRTPQNSGQEEVWANSRSRSAAHTRACGNGGNDRKNRWRKRSPRLPNLSHSVSGFARLVF